MKRWLSALLAVILAAGLLAGCGKEPEENLPQGDASPDSSEAGEEAAGDEADLVVYTPLSQELAQSAAEGFAAQSGVEVRLVYGGTAELIAQIQAGTSPKADVLFGAGAEVVHQFASLFSPYESAEAGELEAPFTDPNGVWTPLTPIPIVLMYNKEQTTRAPAGWSTLLNTSYKGWVAFADPAASGTEYTALCVMHQVGSKDDLQGDAFIQAFAENLDGKLLASVTDVYKQIAQGTFAAGPTLETSVQKYLEAGWEDRVGIAYPEEGTTAALEVSAVVAGAAHIELGRQFIDYVTGADFQAQLVRQFQRRSVRVDISDPEGLTPRGEIPFISYDYDAAVQGRTALLEIFSAAEQSVSSAAADAA